MRWRLIVDVLRRMKKAYAMTAVCVVPQWLVLTLVDAFSPFFFRISMAVLCFTGPLMTTALMQTREVMMRPVTRREVWQATWIVSVVLVPGIFFVAKYFAATLGATFGTPATVSVLPAVALSSLYDAIYSGVALAWLSTARLPLPRGSRIAGAFATAWPNIVIVVFATGAIGPMLLPTLVTNPARLTGGSIGLLIAAGAIALLAYVCVPRGPLPPIVRRHAQQRRDASGAQTRRLADSPNGLMLLLQEEAVLIFLIGLPTLLAIALTFSWIDTGSVAPPLASIRRLVEAAFRTTQSQDEVFGIWTTIVILSSVRNALLPLMRRLRTLPVSTAQSVLLFAALPAATATACWLGLLLMHVAVVGALPAHLNLHLLLSVVGIAVFSQALQLRFGRPAAPSLWVLVPIMVIAPKVVNGMAATGAASVTLALAVALLAIGLAIVHRSITRHAAPYKAVPPPAFPFAASTR